MAVINMTGMAENASSDLITRQTSNPFMSGIMVLEQDQVGRLIFNIANRFKPVPLKSRFRNLS